MNWRKRVLKTIRGEDVDILPFIPRLDIWYKSNKARGTLPAEYAGLTLKEITEELKIGYHSVIPDFRDLRELESEAFLGLGIYDLKTNPYRIRSGNVDCKYQKTKDGITSATFQTPLGEINTKTLYTKKMFQEGSTIGHTVEHALKGINDIKALGYIFENLEVENNYENFGGYLDFIGDDGLHIGFCSLSASPMHHIMKELAPFEEFVYMLNDNPVELEKLSEKIEIFLTKILNVSVRSQADALMLGANYDSFLTWPGFFKKYITSYLKRASGMAHDSGKYLITHADGENEGLLREYLDSNIDIADSICPFPMTRLKIKDIKKCFSNKVTIWGAIPSIIVLEDAVSDRSFKEYVNSFFEDIGDGKHLILSFADTTPPEAKFERILEISKSARDFNQR